MLESGEMYLETILVLSRERQIVRAIDISEHIGYSKPSVSRALSKLRQDGCILVDDDGLISLTGKGAEIAEKIYERHIVLSQMLMALGVDEDTALKDACKMEHDISDVSFEAIKHYLAGLKK